MKGTSILFRNILISTLTVLVVACTKVTTEPCDGPNFTTTVTGYALTTDSLDPIKNLRLSINPIQGSYTTVATGQTVRTDSTGKYSFIYTGPQNGKVGIGFSGSSSCHNYGGYDYISPYYNAKHNIHIQPYGWLKLHIKNINVQSPNDRLSISLGGTVESYYGIVDKTIFVKEPGNGTKQLIWAVEKNDTTSSFRDSIYIVGFDTTFYEILY